jgi:hypothetical protein
LDIDVSTIVNGREWTRLEFMSFFQGKTLLNFNDIQFVLEFNVFGFTIFGVLVLNMFMWMSL